MIQQCTRMLLADSETVQIPNAKKIIKNDAHSMNISQCTVFHPLTYEKESKFEMCGNLAA